MTKPNIRTQYVWCNMKPYKLFSELKAR